MNEKNFNTPLALRDIQVTDSFWEKKMELVRTEVIPYQWDALNDHVEGAAPSFCMRNFKMAAKMNEKRADQGSTYQEPEYTYRGFEMLPEDPTHLEDQFYGFVFQDSDFYKWIEAVGYSLTQHPDPKLEKLADDAVEQVCAAQQEDGYLDTYYILNGKDKIFTNLRDHHELYCLGHLIEGAVAYYQATGKDKLLKAAEGYADYAADYFGAEEGKCKGYPGHEIVEMALVRLYEATGKEKYLNLACFFIDERGTRPYYFDQEHPEELKKNPDGLRYEYHQAHLPVREQKEAVGHAVRGVYLYSGMVDAARYTHDDKLMEACKTLWNSIVNEKMYITGGIGGTHIGEAFSYPYDLPNDTAYAETCAAIGLVFLARRMLETEVNSKYADVMERALYNCVLSGMSLDGKEFFYVNPLEVNPKACKEDQRIAHVKAVRQKWFGCACCPPNLARTISSVSSYAYTEKEDTLFVHLYIGGVIKKQVSNQEMTVTITSGFPWDGKIEIEMEGAPASFTLALRIPDWCGGKYTLEQVDTQDITIKDGYLYITKTWESGDTLSLEFPMEVKIWQANSKVREDIGKVAATRGPIVYCLEEKDNGADLHLLTLDCKSKPSSEKCKVAGEEVYSVILDGYRQTKEKEECSLYHLAVKEEKIPVKLKFIPYYTWANRGENEMEVWVRQN